MSWPLLWLLLSCLSASAQIVISARAGLINYAEGSVDIGEGTLEFDESSFAYLDEGQRLSTGNGRVEVILVPDSFLRMDDNSEIEMLSARLTGTRVRLHRGSAVIDLQQIFEHDSIAILVDDAEIRFSKKGLYWIEVTSSTPASVKVFEGKAVIEAFGHEYAVKGDQVGTLAGAPGRIEIERLNASDTALFDAWRRRGETGLRPFGVWGARRDGSSVWASVSKGMQCAFSDECNVAGLECISPERSLARSAIRMYGAR